MRVRAACCSWVPRAAYRQLVRLSHPAATTSTPAATCCPRARRSAPRPPPCKAPPPRPWRWRRRRALHRPRWRGHRGRGPMWHAATPAWPAPAPRPAARTRRAFRRAPGFAPTAPPALLSTLARCQRCGELPVATGFATPRRLPREGAR
eukprot:4420729-Prymnesium_polylepis.1